MSEVLQKLQELEGQIMTKDAIQSMFNVWKEELVTQGTVESKKSMDLLNGLIEEIAELKADPGKQFATDSQDAVELKRQNGIFEKYLKKGMLGLTPDEQKTMQSNDDTTGGYLAGRQLDKQVIEDVREVSDMMKVATVKQTSSKTYTFIRVNNSSAAGTTAEGVAATAANVTFEKIDIATYSYKASTYITEEDIEDAELSITNIITKQISEGIAEGAEDDFFDGTGVGEPEGILTNAAITSTDTAGSGTFIDEDIMTLLYQLKKGYRSGAVFFANRLILLHIAKMKNGAGDFQFSMQKLDKYPTSIATLMGLPVFEAPAMASTVSAGNIVLAVGDFKKGYVIVERIGTTVKRDDITGIEEGVVKFVGRKRLGGQVVQPEAIKLLTVAS